MPQKGSHSEQDAESGLDTIFATKIFQLYQLSDKFMSKLRFYNSTVCVNVCTCAHIYRKVDETQV